MPDGAAVLPIVMMITVRPPRSAGLASVTAAVRGLLRGTRQGK